MIADAYLIHLLILICIYVILALSLQLSMGFGGMLNLGHLAFSAIGAYASVILNKAGLPFVFCLLIAILLPPLFAYLLSVATSKLKGDYFALATLGFSLVVYATALNWSNLTRGPLGIAGIPKPDFYFFSIESNTGYLLFSAILAILSYFLISKLVKSPYGRALSATRDDELSAKTLAKDTGKIKSLSLMIAASFAGLAGCLLAHYISYIDPATFSFNTLIPILVIVILGGLGSIEGTVIATVIILLIPEAIRFIGLPSSILGPVRQMIYAVLLLLMLIFKPKGFDGQVEL